eukprot:Lithocolla_globosa_v1_NODE_113_length_6217_cov_73.628043.p2 type:complete len:195 gc:universal NODE_113_length_6217_cov_73.628043:4310-3726(-)
MSNNNTTNNQNFIINTKFNTIHCLDCDTEMNKRSWNRHKLSKKHIKYSTCTDECCVCYDRYTATTRVKLDCKHDVCRDCFDKLDRCPLCRDDILTRRHLQLIDNFKHEVNIMIECCSIPVEGIRNCRTKQELENFDLAFFMSLLDGTSKTGWDLVQVLPPKGGAKIVTQQNRLERYTRVVLRRELRNKRKSLAQ